jgi:hypothetical protein
MEGIEGFLPEVPDDSLQQSKQQKTFTPRQVALRNDEAQIDPRGFAPQPERHNSRSLRTRTSLLFVLFEFAIAEGRLELQFPEQCSQIFKLDKFANASFHLQFRNSIEVWRSKLLENVVLKERLLKQHQLELQRLTYPLPKRSGRKPQRKRGYREKGSTRPNHLRGRTDREIVTAIYYEDLVVVEKIRIYGRRPTVTYRRLPYSGKIREMLELGLLERVGDFYIPTPQED